MGETKTNKSLERFNRLISGTQVTGIVLTLSGVVAVAVGVQTPGWLSIGVWLVSSGVLTFNFAQLGKFLRQTALTVVEGSGGNIKVSSSKNNGVAYSQNSQGDSAANQVATERELIGLLSPRQYDAWINAGQPPLGEWDAAGRPEFLEWLKAN